MIEKKWTKGVFLIINLALALLVISPLLYALSASFMTEGELRGKLSLIPGALQLHNYQEALRLAPLFRFIGNSVLVAVGCMAAQLITGALAGYAFALLKFKGQKQIFFLFLMTMMIPGQAIIIANYLMIVNLHLVDTYGALMLPYMTSAFCIFNMRQAFLTLPSELNDSARIDGCNSFQFFSRVALPLTKPQLGSLGIYVFLQVWNQYLWPLLVTNTPRMRTVQIGIGMLQNADADRYGPVMAGTVIVLLPSVLIFILGQRSLISGLTAGAVTG